MTRFTPFSANRHQEPKPYSYIIPKTSPDFPVFDGTHLREWVKGCDHFFWVDRIPTELKAPVASLHMKGRALEWHHEFIRNNFGIFPSWLDYITAVYARFDEHPSQYSSTVRMASPQLPRLPKPPDRVLLNRNPVGNPAPRQNAASSTNKLVTQLPKVGFPLFDGSEMRDWICKCEQIFSIYNTPNAMKVKLATVNVSGKALQWHRTFMAERYGIYPSWTDYIIALSAKFYDPWNELRNLRQVVTPSPNNVPNQDVSRLLPPKRDLLQNTHVKLCAYRDVVIAEQVLVSSENEKSGTENSSFDGVIYDRTYVAGNISSQDTPKADRFPPAQLEPKALEREGTFSESKSSLDLITVATLAEAESPSAENSKEEKEKVERYLDSSFKRELANLDKDQETNKILSNSISVVKESDARVIHVVNVQVSETNENGSKSGSYAVSPFEDLVCTHEDEAVLHAEMIMQMVIRTLNSIEEAQQNCSKAVVAKAKHGIDLATPRDKKINVIQAPCKSLSDYSLDLHHFTLRSGLCLKLLGDCKKGYFTSTEMVSKDLQCLGVVLEAALGEAMFYMALVVGFDNYNHFIIKAYAKRLVRSDLRILDLGAIKGGSQKRILAIQRLNFLIKNWDTKGRCYALQIMFHESEAEIASYLCEYSNSQRLITNNTLEIEKLHEMCLLMSLHKDPETFIPLAKKIRDWLVNEKFKIYMCSGFNLGTWVEFETYGWEYTKQMSLDINKGLEVQEMSLLKVLKCLDICDSYKEFTRSKESLLGLLYGSLPRPPEEHHAFTSIPLINAVLIATMPRQSILKSVGQVKLFHATGFQRQDNLSPLLIMAVHITLIQSLGFNNLLQHHEALWLAFGFAFCSKLLKLSKISSKSSQPLIFEDKDLLNKGVLL